MGVEPDLVTLVFDETGDAKKGRRTVGVQRQYSGTCGRIENCQIAVFATLATPAGHTFVDVELYLPQCWTSDVARRAAAGVPADAELATKPQLALRMTDRILAAGAGVGWIAADEAYGDNPELRHALQVRGLNYVMAVSRDTQIPTPAGKLRADKFVEQVPRNGWQILSAGRGSKGERLYAWAFTSISDSEPTHHRWLLLRRNLHTGELAYFLCHATTAVPLATLVRVAGTRWRVEENFQAGKGCAGLDEHQVRTWTSWHRWTTLAMLAHAFLAVTAARAQQPTTTHTASTTPSNPAQRVLNIGAWGESVAQFSWRTPDVEGGHYCVTVECFHPADREPANNVGQENTDVRRRVSSGGSLRLIIPFYNRNETARDFRVAVDDYQITDNTVSVELRQIHGVDGLSPEDRRLLLVPLRADPAVLENRDRLRRFVERDAMRGARIRVRPSDRRERRGVGYRVFGYEGVDRIRRGNDASDVALGGGWEVDFPDAITNDGDVQLVVPPGSTAQVVVVVRAPTRAAVGEQKQINVTVRDGAHRVVGGVTLDLDLEGEDDA